jgi:hypothetical protein
VSLRRESTRDRSSSGSDRKMVERCRIIYVLFDGIVDKYAAKGTGTMIDGFAQGS